MPALARWEQAYILTSWPTGKPSVVPPKSGFDWSSVRADVLHVVKKHSATEAHLSEWEAFIAERPKTHEDAMRVTTLPKWNLTPISEEHDSLEDHRGAAMRTVRADMASVYTWPRCIRSSYYNGAEGAAAARARATDNEERQLLRVEPSSWGFIKVEYTDEPANGGCRIPAILVQFAESFGAGVDTTQPLAKLTVKWWEPKPPHGRYDGDWRKWTGERRRQHESQIERREVAMLNVQFTRAEPLVGGVRRLNKATKERLQADEFFEYATYSSSA